jgi:hypothetical protein
MNRFVALLFLLSLVACSPQTPVANMDVARIQVDVYIDAFSEPWLPALYDCAERSPTWLVARTPNVDSANISLTVNSQQITGAASYQIDEIEFLAAVNAQNPLELRLTDIQAIYAGQVYNWAQLGWDDALIHAWGYSPGTGVNEILLGTGNLSSLVYQAESPRAMRAVIEKDVYAIGFLPRTDFSPDDAVRAIIPGTEIFLPVLALVPEGDADFSALIACLN